MAFKPLGEPIRVGLTFDHASVRCAHGVRVIDDRLACGVVEHLKAPTVGRLRVALRCAIMRIDAPAGALASYAARPSIR